MGGSAASGSAASGSAASGSAASGSAAGGSAARVLRIDCAYCIHQHSDVCGDCLVTFLCEREDDGAVVVPLDEIRAVRLLQDRGLAPRNRHRSSRPPVARGSMEPWVDCGS